MPNHPPKATRTYIKRKPPDEDRRHLKAGVRDGFDMSGGVTCKGCFAKKLEIDALRAEVAQLKQKLAYQQKRAKQGYFGSSTPSAKLPVKASTDASNRAKKGGARLGHKGHGRKAAAAEDADLVLELPMPKRCADCDLELTRKGTLERTIVDVETSQAERHVYRLQRGLCPGCGKTKTAPVPAMRKGLYSHRLVAKAAVMHYLHGITLGKIVEIFGGQVTEGGLVEAFHRLGAMSKDAQHQLVDDYRKSHVRHADETTWRTDGQSGYTWLFCSADTSIFRFGRPRSGDMVEEVLGKKWLPGVLVVDRFGAYNRAPCALQYCLAHLLREVDKVEDQFPGEPEVKGFVCELGPKLAEAMRLRSQPISDDEYAAAALRIKEQITQLAKRPARHEAVRHLQRLFSDDKRRLFRWASDRRIPAENNFAERELRPTVIARKVSFGSQSDKGAETRSNLMSLLHTTRKRLERKSVEDWLAEELAGLSRDDAANPRLAAPPRPASRHH
jgi:transposase